ncbi:hypothetical protein LY90DRAFT_675396 [Neocallimastix californiae]|uniref:Uncharacterized protein n=1 Tax=Neocallimastix californiae TaxID=1754190 RepID=A0A1Y2AMR9_9FUNG|nr:hypothetical protein LY90DRAFT_675396 [Neocallimastix californiae]|eukprot:ORY23851.1 hypothetical protein LY90DRAFT_675396 [Neocallimastix californiae]
MSEDIQKIINSTNYWDLKVLDFNCSFFGDEVVIFIENDENTSWKISFRVCKSVKYETDAAWSKTWRKGKGYVREMNSQQLGYYCQDITVQENNEYEGFYNVTFDLSIMTGKIICKEINVECLPNKQLNFFWNKE